MPTATALRHQIETNLADRIPSALTPAVRTIRPVAASRIQAIDELLDGGLPLGAITEIVGPESSGRTSLALSFIAGMTRAEKVCSWIDVSDELDPESAAEAGVDLSWLLWVRCGVQPASWRKAREPQVSALPAKHLAPQAPSNGLHRGDFGPRSEAKRIFSSVNDLFGPRASSKPLSGLEQALRVTDLLLQGGGLSAIVLDMSSIASEHASRVPLSTWFRYRAAAEKAQASIVLLTVHPCAKNSAELLLRLYPGTARCDEATVFTGIEHHLEVIRRRFAEPSAKVVPLNKPPQRATSARWQSQPAWAGQR